MSHRGVSHVMPIKVTTNPTTLLFHKGFFFNVSGECIQLWRLQLQITTTAHMLRKLQRAKPAQLLYECVLSVSCVHHRCIPHGLHLEVCSLWTQNSMDPSRPGAKAGAWHSVFSVHRVAEEWGTSSASLVLVNAEDADSVELGELGNENCEERHGVDHKVDPVVLCIEAGKDV